MTRKSQINQIDRIKVRSLRSPKEPDHAQSIVRKKVKWFSHVSLEAYLKAKIDDTHSLYRLTLAPKFERFGRLFGFTAWYKTKYGFTDNAEAFVLNSVRNVIDDDLFHVISLCGRDVESGNMTYIQYKKDENHQRYLELLAGRISLESYVKSIYPENEYPLLYSRYPVDLEIPEILNGRSIHDENVQSLLGGKYMPSEQLQEIYDEAVKFGAGDMLEGILIQSLPYAFFGTCFFLFIVYAAHLVQGVSSVGSTSNINALINASHDSWGSGIAESSMLAWIGNAVGSSITRLLQAVCLLGIFSTLYVATGLRYVRNTRGIKAIMRLRTRFWIVADGLAGHFRNHEDIHNTRKINEFKTALIRAGSQVGDQSTPLYILGTATGHFNYRGLPTSPAIETPMALSMLDMGRHLLVMGGTGGGKTSQVAKPIIARTLEMRAEGLPVAMYVTDGKAVLYNTVLEEASKVGIRDQVRVIGPGAGQIRVDLLEGVDPATFADVMRSVAQQIGGGRSDGNFWPQMASSMVMETGIILQAAELTNWGIEYSRKTGKRAYSIQQIIHYSSEPQAMLDGPVRAISEAMNDPEQYKCIAIFDKPALHNAIEQRIGFWHTLADATRTGIVANIRNALQLFMFNDEIASGFADGAGENLMSATDVFGNYVTCTSISTSEHGAAGKLTLTLLKTIFMREARLRELKHPEAAGQREAFWKSPDMKKVAEIRPGEVSNYMQTIYLADEYQELISSDTSSAYSDSTFWNVARSAGVAGVVMFQTLKALTQAIGTEATENFVGNFRSKILLPVEDITTISWFSELIGKGYGDQNYSWFGRYYPPTQSDVDQYVEESKELVYIAPPEFKHQIDPQEYFLPERQSLYEYVTDGNIGTISLGPFKLGNISLFTATKGWDKLKTPKKWAHANEVNNSVATQFFNVIENAGKKPAAGSLPTEDNILEIGEIKDLPFGYGIAMLNRAGVVRSDVIDLTNRMYSSPL